MPITLPYPQPIILTLFIHLWPGGKKNMSQPQVLKHSHSPFIKKTEPQTIDLSNSGPETDDTTTRVNSQHLNASEPSNLAKGESDDNDNDTTSEDGSISGSALEDELERAELSPFVEEGNIRISDY